jgi:hypothetical protein
VKYAVKKHMKDKNWYLHISGEAVGPLSTAVVTKMIQQNRCNAADYVCCVGEPGWTRLADCGEFANLWPAMPKIAVPRPAPAAAPKAEAPAPIKFKSVPRQDPEPDSESQPEPQADATSEFARPQTKAVKAKSAPEPVAAPAPKSAPAPKPAPAPVATKPWDATAKINGAKYKVSTLTETAVVFDKSPGLDVGADVKVRLESSAWPKGLEVTGLMATETKVAFTRMNPAHRRSIAQYLAEHGAPQEDKNAA